MKRLLAVMVVLAFFSPGVMADIVIFRSGSAREGIIEEETATSVKMRIRNAVIGFSRDNIERIEYSSAAENGKLDEKWKQEEKQKEEKLKNRREEKKRAEKLKIDEGLEKVGEEWVSRKRKAEIKQEGIESEIAAQKRTEAEAALESERAAVWAEREKASDENRLPEYLKQIVVGKLSVDYNEEEDETVLTGRVTNSGKLIADVISLRVEIHDKNGRLIRIMEEELYDIGPSKHQILTLPLDVRESDIGSTEALVTEVRWR